MARINDPNASPLFEYAYEPECDPIGLEIHEREEELRELVERCRTLRSEIQQLRDENKWLRAMSGSGYARGRIKAAPRIEWNVKPEREDLL